MSSRKVVNVAPRLFRARIRPAKRFAFICKVNQFGRRPAILIRSEVFGPIVSSLEDHAGLRSFLLQNHVIRPQDKLRLEIFRRPSEAQNA